MSNLQVYTGQVSNVQEALTISKHLAESGMFADARQAAQAFVKVQAGAEMGIPPYAAMTGIHIISGKPVLGAGLLAARIKASGKYTYRTIEHTAQVCELAFYEGATEIGRSKFTIEQARKAGVKNLDKFPENMLFARAISNGAKWHCPDLFAGIVYSDADGFETPPVQDVPHTVVPQAAPTELFPSQQPQVAQVAAFEAQAPAATPAPARNADQRPWLKDEQFMAMMDAIAAGKGVVVLDKMENYKIKRDYRERLNAALSEANAAQKTYPAAEPAS